MHKLLLKHPLPWRFVKVTERDGTYFPTAIKNPQATQAELDELQGGYGRLSNGILDANGKCVILCDPSESEYAFGMEEDSALCLVDYMNGGRP